MNDRVVWVFTRSGAAAVAIGIVSYVAGWLLGWVELMVLAGGCLVALAIAAPFVVGRSRLSIVRTVSPTKVRAGDTAIAELRATNTHRMAMRPSRVEEQIDGRPLVLDIPRLSAGEEHLAVYPLPTERRGVRRIGPAVLTRTDPIGLLRRQVAHTTAELLWVHPRWRLVRPLPAGFAKDLEGPTADDSPSGDIAFHAVRPYQMGDDPRHVHWMSSARTGEVMVRHYVDNRRPHVTVLVDRSPATYEGDEFEVAIQAAASIVVSLGAEHLPVALRVGAEWICGRAHPADRDIALDRLTVVQPGDDGRLVSMLSDALRVEQATSVIAVIATSRAVGEVLACAGFARRHARVIVVDVTADPEAGGAPVPGTRTVRAADLDGFVAGWNRIAR